MPLNRCHESDAAVAVPLVVPVHERHHPAAGVGLAGEGAHWVVRPVFHRPEQRLRGGVVVAHPGSGEGSEHTQLLQAAFQRGGPHGIAVVGMEDQGLRASAIDALPQAGSADEISRDLGVFPFSDIPGHHLAAPDVDHQIEVEPDAPDAGGQVGDVPAPDLIRPVSPQARNRTRLLRRAGSPAAVRLPMGMEHPIEAALRANVEAPIGQNGNDLPGRQSGEFRLVAGEQNPLTLLVREAMRHVAWTAFTAIQSVPITGELTPPALQGRQTHAQ